MWIGLSHRRAIVVPSGSRTVVAVCGGLTLLRRPVLCATRRRAGAIAGGRSVQRHEPSVRGLVQGSRGGRIAPLRLPAVRGRVCRRVRLGRARGGGGGGRRGGGGPRGARGPPPGGARGGGGPPPPVRGQGGGGAGRGREP